MTETPTSKYLNVFPGATTEHAKSVMNVEHIPTRNTQKSVFLTLDDLPSMVYPGHPGHHWLSIAVESEVPMIAWVALSPPWKSAPFDPPPVVWSCVFEVSDDDPDRLQDEVDDLLTRYLRAGFELSPSLVYRPEDLITDRNMLALALSEEHLDLMGREKGATPLLTDKSVEVFTVGNVEVRVENPQVTYRRFSEGWSKTFKSLLTSTSLRSQ